MESLAKLWVLSSDLWGACVAPELEEKRLIENENEQNACEDFFMNLGD